MISASRSAENALRAAKQRQGSSQAHQNVPDLASEVRVCKLISVGLLRACMQACSTPRTRPHAMLRLPGHPALWPAIRFTSLLSRLTPLAACWPTPTTLCGDLYDLLPECCRRRWRRQMLRPKLHARARLGGTADHLVALPTDDLQLCRLVCTISITTQLAGCIHHDSHRLQRSS